LRVLESENFLEENLYEFLLSGPLKIEDKFDIPKECELPWMTRFIWTNLHYLSKKMPFTNKNLKHHIIQNQHLWDDLYQQKSFTFEQLPNKSKIDLKPFIFPDEEEQSDHDENEPDSSKLTHYSKGKE
jgi:hypothetical protein